MLERRLTIAFATLASLLLCASSATAQTELKNDNFTSGGAATFMGGFVAGEMGASRFVPAGPCTITKIQLLFGGSATTQTATLHIFDDSAQTTVPGAELMTATDVTLTGSNSAMNEIDVTAIGAVTTSGPFRVALEWQHAGFPSIANDSDGMTFANRNFIKNQAGAWGQSNAYLVKGDWIIRALVVYDNAQTDGGVAEDAAVPQDASSTADAPAQADAARQQDGGGGSCQGNTDCPGGQYCGPQSTCTFDCVIDADCGGNKTCSSLGQCVAKSSSGCSLGASDASPRWLLGALLLVGIACGALRRRRRP